MQDLTMPNSAVLWGPSERGDGAENPSMYAPSQGERGGSYGKEANLKGTGLGNIMNTAAVCFNYRRP